MRHISVAITINRTARRNIQLNITKTVDASNAAQRKATSSSDCEDAFSLTSKLAEELEIHFTVQLTCCYLTSD